MLKGVGLDVTDLDRSVSPCQDFYEFSGGSRLRTNPIPSHATSWGPRNLLGLRTQATLKQILEDAAANRSATPGSNPQKVGDFYAAAIDTVAILPERRAGRQSSRPEALRQEILTDPHSPGQYRSIGPLMNMPQFQAAFGCREGDKMVRTHANRAVIW